MFLLLSALSWAIPRETVLDHAAAYAIHAWTSTAANESASCTDYYDSDYTPGDHLGLPYDWGGYMTLSEFDDQIAAGYGAGSHSWHGILECTAGVDCSGFISQTWETGHYSTSTFDSVTTDIDYSQLERGDAVNDPGSHMVLYAYETEAGVPVFYEAAGSAERTRINSSSGWSYLDGYQPIRFDDIEDGPETATAADPREITSFPYYDQRWTAGAPSDTIDSYACAPDTDESGPEVLYHFTAATAGTLTAVVSDDSGVDIDVHVLTAPDGDTCLGRDDTEVTVEVPAGDVWLALDTYVSGSEFPGPYLLSVTFDGTVGSGEADTGGEVDEDDGEMGDEDTGEEPTDEPEAGADSGGGMGEILVRSPVEGPGALTGMEETGGCGCTSTAAASGWWALFGVGALWKRRRAGTKADLRHL